MDRRHFLIRGLGATLALSLPRFSSAANPDSTAAADSTSQSPTNLAKGLEEMVTIAVGGDTTLGYNLEAHFDQQIAAGTTKEQLWPLYFAGIRPILGEADLALVNLECPFTERGKKLKKNFNFRARKELVKILQEGSVDVVSLANNHTADWGRDGVADTIATVDAAGIARFGAGMNLAEARKPAVCERRGMKIGFVGWYFQAHPDMLEPRAVYATRNRAGVAGCYKSLSCIKAMVREDLEKLAPQVDVMIPYFHWGHEGSYEVRDYQVELAHLCVDLGCKAVLGAHPHRLQGIEVYRKVPIFYSLGNFVYGGIKEPKDTLTAIAKLSVSKIASFGEVIPVQFTRWPDAPFQPFVLEGDAREEALTRIAHYSARFPETVAGLVPYRERQVAAPSDSLGTAR